MAIFDIEKDELLRLTDSQLEELTARLAEAEVAAHGHSPAWVNWSGSINAPDGGIDVHVQVPIDKLSTGFIERPDTIFQAKKPSMSASAIKNEMETEQGLLPLISEQVSKRGGYVIVCLSDDCSPISKMKRLQAMQEAVKDEPNNGNIHLDFFDRSKLTQWLRQHPSVMLWVKGILGQGYSGWQPYGAWSNPPNGVVDTLILAPGVTVTLPSGQGQKLSIEDAINPMRELIRSTKKAIRITGLSGVGKTRIVQALFDESVGSDPLDRTSVIYVDTGADPAPSATAMLERLIVEDRRAIMILDNCPSALHSLLAGKISAVGNKVRLITIEYDIRDDKPQTTEVIRIEAFGPEVAEQLLIRRFPRIGHHNARRIAAFADGNARVSLAIAERVEEGESLAQLSDAQLFNRLFEQRNDPDDDLREQAEILSLVYSFSISTSEGGINELEALGSLGGYSYRQLFKTVTNLLNRHVIQKRANWRAVLPHAIANKLAASALDSIPVHELRDTFEAPGRQRLLISFAHRLGLLHEHAVAKEIVEAWLQPGDLLGRGTELDDASIQMLAYIGPVAPETLLNRIEEELTSSDFKGMERRYSLRRTTMFNLLQSLAYEPETFERCVRLLIHAVDYEVENNNHDSVRGKIKRLYQPYLSGTQASLDQRLAILKQCLSSDVVGRKELGLMMLSTALSGPPWTGFGANEFGARPRDYGFQPTYEELVEWRSAFIEVAVNAGTCGIPAVEETARQLLARAFRSIWRQEAARTMLIDAAHKLHSYYPWVEGWKAVRSTIYFDYTKRRDIEDLEPLPSDLVALESELEPHDLVPEIMAYVLSNGRDYLAFSADTSPDEPNKFANLRTYLDSKAYQLGQDFASSQHTLDELGPNLFLVGGMPYRVKFGQGLARGALDLRECWQQLVAYLDIQTGSQKDFAVIRGFIDETDTIDSILAQEFLDQCVRHPELRYGIVYLHPWREFTETDLDRCLALLDDPDIMPSMYGQILWGDQYAHLPEPRIVDLAHRLLSMPNGDDVILEALSMKLSDQKDGSSTLGFDLLQIGLKAAIQRFKREHNDSAGGMDYGMECVVGAILRLEGNEAGKLEWLNTIFAVVDEQYGCIHSFEDTIKMTAASMPEAFLSRIFEGTEEQQQRRIHFIHYDDVTESPIANIDVNVLIEWCLNRNDINVWAPLAKGIRLWSVGDDLDKVTMQVSAIRFLEAAPVPKAVLEEFAYRVTPTSWWGSRVNVMQPRANTISRLIEHERTDIAAAARIVSEKLNDWIEHEKLQEQQEDEMREQRFE
ncbi:hypothetical protein DMY11_16875 [Escherichia coli]|nr:hypothetical protein [Escherichia coli]